jgi:hypothetical protein
MIRSKEKVIPKPQGRPATGKDPLIAFRSPPELIARIDGFAEAANASRSEAIRRLLEKGLKG